MSKKNEIVVLFRRDHTRVLPHSCSEGAAVFEFSSKELLTPLVTTLQLSSDGLFLRNLFRDYTFPQYQFLMLSDYLLPL